MVANVVPVFVWAILLTTAFYEPIRDFLQRAPRNVRR
jgi:hypothetical protein